MRKKKDKIFEEQNEKTKKSIMEAKEEFVKQIEGAEEACIVITEKGLSIIGGYVQCKSALASALSKMVEDNMFDKEDIKEIAIDSITLSESALLARLFGELVEGDFDGRK